MLLLLLLLLQESYINKHNYLQKMEALAKAYCFYTFGNYQNHLFCHF